MLTVLDCYTRECLAIEVGQSLKEDDIVKVLDTITEKRGLPQPIKTDSGSEFISKALDIWACERRVELTFSRPGKPTDTANCFLSLDDAKGEIEAWRKDYNESRPHSAPNWQAPAKFARQFWGKFSDTNSA